MQIRFYVDPRTNQPHILRHEVTEEEVQQALDRPGEDRPGTDSSRVAIGQTDAGRYLRVIYVPDPDPPGGIFVITAYQLDGKALTAYRRRRRGRRT